MWPKLKIITLSGLIFALMPLESQAVPILANSAYDLSGGFTLVADRAGTQDYVFLGTFQSGSKVETGSQLPNRLESLTLDTVLNFSVRSYDTTTGAVGTTDLGTLVAGLDASFSQIRHSVAGNVAAGIQNEVSGGAILVNASGTINGSSVSFSAPLMSMFIGITLGQYGGAYDNAISTFGAFPIAFALGNVGTGNTSNIDGWLAGDTVIGGVGYHLSGDVHGALSNSTNAVPEPATMGLLSLGLFGGRLMRKRKASV